MFCRMVVKTELCIISTPLFFKVFDDDDGPLRFVFVCGVRFHLYLREPPYLTADRAGLCTRRHNTPFGRQSFVKPLMAPPRPRGFGGVIESLISLRAGLGDTIDSARLFFSNRYEIYSCVRGRVSLVLACTACVSIWVDINFI